MGYNDEEDDGDDDNGSRSLTATTTNAIPSLSQFQYDFITRIVFTAPPHLEAEWKDLFNSHNQVLITESHLYQRQGPEELECFRALLQLSGQEGRTWQEKWESAHHTWDIPFNAQMTAQGYGGQYSTERGGGYGYDSDRSRPRSPAGQTASPARFNRSSNVPPLTATPTRRRSQSGLANPTAPSSRVRRAPLADSIDSSSDDSLRPQYSARPTTDNLRRSPRMQSTTLENITPRSHPSSPRLPPSTPSFVESEMDRLLDQLQQRAIEIHRLTLIGHALSRWRSQVRVIRAREMRVVESRCRVMVAKTMGRWKQRMEQIDTLTRRVELVEQEIIRRDLSTSFTLWAHRMDKRRREEWEGRLRSAWEEFGYLSKRRMIHRVFLDWAESAREGKCVRFQQTHYRDTAFSIWRDRFKQHVESSAKAESFFHRNDELIKWNVMDSWKLMSELSQRERYFIKKRDDDLLRECIGTWQTSLHAIEEAKEFRNASFTKSAFKRWRSRCQHIHNLELACDEEVNFKNRALLAKVFNHLTVECSSRLHYHLRSQALIRSVFHHWSTRCSTRQTVVSTFLKRKASKSLASSMSLWQQRFADRITAVDLAESWDNRRLLGNMYDEWSQAKQYRDDEWERAVARNDTFLRGSIFDRWRTRAAQLRQGRWIARGEEQRKRNAFLVWNALLRRNLENRRRIEMIEMRRNHNLRVSTLEQWKQRVIEFRSRTIEVSAEYDRKMLKSTLAQWKTRCVVHGEMLSLAESYETAADDSVMRECWSKWTYVRLQASHRQAKLDQLLDDQRRLTLELAWEIWRDQFMERILRGPEIELVTFRGQKLLEKSWKQWESSTKTLPALRFKEASTKRRFFKKWRSELSDPQSVALARDKDRSFTTARYLRLWHLRCRSNIAIRAANRFQALSTSPAVRRDFSLSRPLIIPSPPPVSIIRSSPRPVVPSPARRALFEGLRKTPPAATAASPFRSSRLIPPTESPLARLRPGSSSTHSSTASEVSDDGPATPLTKEERRARLREAALARRTRS